MTPIFLLSVPGSGTIFTVRQLTAFGYVPAPDPSRVMPGEYVQLHTLSPGDDQFLEVPTVVPLRPPHDTFVTMYGRGISEAEIVAHWERLLDITRRMNAATFIDAVGFKRFVRGLAEFCQAEMPDEVDYSLANKSTRSRMDRVKQIRDDRADMGRLAFASKWTESVLRRRRQLEAFEDEV